VVGRWWAGNHHLPFLQTIDRLSEPLRDPVRVAACDACAACLAFGHGVAEQVGDVIRVDVGRPKPGGKGVPEIVKMKVADPGGRHRTLEADQ